MKIDFNQTLLGIDGEPIVQVPAQNGEPAKFWTLKDAAVTAIRSILRGDDDLDAIKKVELGTIGVCIFKGLDLTTEQVAVVKARIGKAFLNGEMVLAAWNAIESPAASEVRATATLP